MRKQDVPACLPLLGCDGACRYVVLHQTDNTDPDPFGWKVAYKPSGHSWRGLSKEDAFGAALDYIDLVREAVGAGLRSTTCGVWFASHCGSSLSDAEFALQKHLVDA